MKTKTLSIFLILALSPAAFAECPTDAVGVLNDLYTSEIAYKVENRFYTTDLKALGWNCEPKYAVSISVWPKDFEIRLQWSANDVWTVNSKHVINHEGPEAAEKFNRGTRL